MFGFRRERGRARAGGGVIDVFAKRWVDTFGLVCDVEHR